MYPSATLCLAQAQFHNDRADAAILENVRMISIKAAKAWSQEAIFARQREDRQAKAREATRLETAAKSGAWQTVRVVAGDEPRPGHEIGLIAPLADQDLTGEGEFDDLFLSENPDRGHAV